MKMNKDFRPGLPRAAPLTAVGVVAEGNAMSKPSSYVLRVGPDLYLGTRGAGPLAVCLNFRTVDDAYAASDILPNGTDYIVCAVMPSGAVLKTCRRCDGLCENLLGPMVDELCSSCCDPPGVAG